MLCCCPLRLSQLHLTIVLNSEQLSGGLFNDEQSRCSILCGIDAVSDEGDEGDVGDKGGGCDEGDKGDDGGGGDEGDEGDEGDVGCEGDEKGTKAWAIRV